MRIGVFCTAKTTMRDFPLFRHADALCPTRGSAGIDEAWVADIISTGRREPVDLDIARLSRGCDQPHRTRLGGGADRLSQSHSSRGRYRDDRHSLQGAVRFRGRQGRSLRASKQAFSWRSGSLPRHDAGSAGAGQSAALSRPCELHRRILSGERRHDNAKAPAKADPDLSGDDHAGRDPLCRAQRFRRHGRPTVTRSGQPSSRHR